MQTCAIVAALFIGSMALAADDKPAIKEISAKELKVKFPEKGKATEPKEIKTADELAKSEVLGGAAEEIKKQVDFAKEKLVAFAWGGSGRDKLSPELKTADGKTAAVFTFTRGLTRDFRQHIHVYVVPKDAEVKVETAKSE